MNAVVLAQGLMKNGPHGAREELKKFWKMMSDTAAASPMQPSWIDQLLGRYGFEYSPLYHLTCALSLFFSPYQMNPFNMNPLKQKLEEFVEFEKLRQFKDFKVFLCATNVKTSKLKIFSLPELRSQCLLASACLPQLFQAVEVDGDYYWDGGFIGNPPLFPLIEQCETRDLVVVPLSPTNRPHVPTTASEISARLTEISCVNTLVREMRAIDFITHLIDEGIADQKKMKRLFMHMIGNEEVFHPLSYSSPMNANWDFLSYLFEKGREVASQWLQQNFDKIGVESSCDIHKNYVS
jgi:NTE family protein